MACFALVSLEFGIHLQIRNHHLQPLHQKTWIVFACPQLLRPIDVFFLVLVSMSNNYLRNKNLDSYRTHLREVEVQVRIGACCYIWIDTVCKQHPSPIVHTCLIYCNFFSCFSQIDVMQRGRQERVAVFAQSIRIYYIDLGTLAVDTRAASILQSRNCRCFPNDELWMVVLSKFFSGACCGWEELSSCMCSNPDSFFAFYPIVNDFEIWR